jgi:hypothetical protein
MVVRYGHFKERENAQAWKRSSATAPFAGSQTTGRQPRCA